MHHLLVWWQALESVEEAQEAKVWSQTHLQSDRNLCFDVSFLGGGNLSNSEICICGLAMLLFQLVSQPHTHVSTSQGPLSALCLCLLNMGTVLSSANSSDKLPHFLYVCLGWKLPGLKCKLPQKNTSQDKFGNLGSFCSQSLLAGPARDRSQLRHGGGRHPSRVSTKYNHRCHHKGSL